MLNKYTWKFNGQSPGKMSPITSGDDFIEEQQRPHKMVVKYKDKREVCLCEVGGHWNVILQPIQCGGHLAQIDVYNYDKDTQLIKTGKGK